MIPLRKSNRFSTSWGASGPAINQAAYTYNGVGNRDSLTDRRGVQNFGYDNLDRLTSASYPWLGMPQAFTYNAVTGDRESVSLIFKTVADPIRFQPYRYTASRDTTGEPYAFEWWDVETWCRISLRLL